MSRKAFITMAVIVVVILTSAGAAVAALQLPAAAPIVVQDAPISALRMPKAVDISVSATSAPSAIGTATALSIANGLAGNSIASAAASITIERAAVSDPPGSRVTLLGDVPVSSWVVTFHGLTLSPAGPAGMPSRSYSGMNHTEIIDANTGEVIKAMEYMPQ